MKRISLLAAGAQPDGPKPDGPAQAPLVQLDNVTVTYARSGGILGRRRAPIHAVNGVSLEVERGRSLGLLGQTGAGKSTVAQLLMGMVRPTSGRVLIDGIDLAQLRGRQRRRIFRLRQVVLQDPFSSLDPRMRVREIIAEPLHARGYEARMTRREMHARVDELLDLVGLPTERVSAYPHEFSGGQRQRISIARALAPKPSLIVLDEPTSALDVSIRAQILSLLRGLREELDLTYLVISHDIATVAYLASSTAIMYAGRVVERASTRELLEHPAHPYTQHLLSCVPRPDVNFLAHAPTQDDHDGPAVDVTSSGCPYYGGCPVRRSLSETHQITCLRAPQLLPVRAAPEDHQAGCHFLDIAAQPSSSEHAYGPESDVADSSVEVERDQ